MSRHRKLISNAISFLCVLGMADAGYLTIAHYRELQLPGCSVESCGKVLTHFWSHPSVTVLGWTTPALPTSLYGFVFYAMTFLALGWNVSPRWLLFLTTPACGIHLFFVYVQAFIIHAFCTYCLVSAGLTTLVWLLSFALYRASK